MAKARRKKAVKARAKAAKPKARRKASAAKPKPMEKGFFESFLALFASPSEGRKS